MDAILFNPENSKRRALILSLGRYGTERLSPGELEPLIGRLLDLYRNDTDAGVHGAAEWTLRQWGQQEKLQADDAKLMKVKDWGDRRWFVNSQGQTFAVIDGPVEFSMGSPPADAERFADYEPLRERFIIPRRFALAVKAVSVGDYREFLQQRPKAAPLDLDRYNPEPTGPINGVTWYEAAAYCNWLSEKDRIPESQWCYESKDGDYGEGMTIPEDALDRPGYRLPTEAEWEYACRSGANTSRYYGQSIELLGKYARYSANSEEHAWPCGSLLPNDLGLFDVLGNVFEWCLGAYGGDNHEEGESQCDDFHGEEKVSEKPPRLLRGGTFFNPPSHIRSSYRNWVVPSDRDIFVNGLRPARTYP
jgi:formylglycine-generating enzyme required for sulfatase activity